MVRLLHSINLRPQEVMDNSLVNKRVQNKKKITSHNSLEIQRSSQARRLLKCQDRTL